MAERPARGREEGHGIGQGEEKRALPLAEQKQYAIMAVLGGRILRFRRCEAEFRGITDDRRLAPRSPGSDGAFLMESRDAACFVMLAGLLCSCSR